MNQSISNNYVNRINQFHKTIMSFEHIRTVQIVDYLWYDFNLQMYSFEWWAVVADTSKRQNKEENNIN